MNIFSQYLIPFLALPLLGTIIGSWLSQLYFPFKKKKLEWRWEKEVFATKTFYENISRVSFLSRNYLKSEYQERFSMTALGLQQTNDEIINIVRSLHVNAHKISIYLEKFDSELFEQYLKNSQGAFDEASQSWGAWYDDESGYNAKNEHTEKTIHAQGKLADEIIQTMKKNSKESLKYRALRALDSFGCSLKN